MYLFVERIACGPGLKPFIREFTLQVDQGQFLAVVGPNGSGKTTLLRAITKALPLVAGRVVIDGLDLAAMRPQELARQVAVVAQETAVEFEFTVAELVMLGRLPHLPRFGRESPKDEMVVVQAMQATGIFELKERLVTTLSGGERQRMMVARALAQEPRLLLLDEPTAHLDIQHQVEVLDLVRRLNRNQGLTVVAVLHDLNLAAQYADRILMLKAGERFAEGSPSAVITEANIAAVYGSKVRVIDHPLMRTPQVMLLCADAVS